MRNCKFVLLLLIFIIANDNSFSQIKQREKVVLFSLLPNVEMDSSNYYKIVHYHYFLIKDKIYKSYFVKNKNIVCVDDLSDEERRFIVLNENRDLVSRLEFMYLDIDYKNFQSKNKNLNNAYFFKAISFEMEYITGCCFDKNFYIDVLSDLLIEDTSIFPLDVSMDSVQECELSEKFERRLIKYLTRRLHW